MHVIAFRCTVFPFVKDTGTCAGVCPKRTVHSLPRPGECLGCSGNSWCGTERSQGHLAPCSLQFLHSHLDCLWLLFPAVLLCSTFYFSCFFLAVDSFHAHVSLSLGVFRSKVVIGGP